MVTRADWVHAFERAMGFPDTPENLLAALSWIRSEEGAREPIPATWNPLNTTYNLPPCTDFNSVGVKNYETFEQGLSANVKTLGLNYYPAIRDAFRAGNNAQTTIDAIHASPWGSKPNSSTLAFVRQNLAADSALVVGAGTVVAPPPPPSPPPGPIGGTVMYLAPVAHPSAPGYWCVDIEGHVFAYGAAQYHGGQGWIDPAGKAVHLNGKCVGLAPTPTGKGYWLLTDAGSIYTFGDAAYLGDPHA